MSLVFESRARKLSNKVYAKNSFLKDILMSEIGETIFHTSSIIWCISQEVKRQQDLSIL